MFERIIKLANLHMRVNRLEFLEYVAESLACLLVCAHVKSADSSVQPSERQSEVIAPSMTANYVLASGPASGNSR